MTERRRRLIEVAFPLEEVSAHSRREKNVRHGHISTLHIWWARRPLAACRAFIYASLVDDPATDAERDELLKEVADLASWDAVRKPELVVRAREKGGSGRTGHDLLERARQRILACNGGKPPRLLDPFAGGGAIPLEALRLGCEVEASDLNPVAVLILKGTVEYPQKYGRPLADQREQLRRGERDSVAGVNGEVPRYIREAARSAQSSFAESDLVSAYERNPLAADVRYWGNWILERARAELADFYPPDPDGSVPVAYLWSRTIPCPNCGAEMPLIRQYWLARKEHKKIALEPMIDSVGKRVDFAAVSGANVTGDPSEATTSRGDTQCLLCRQVVKAEQVRESARSGRMGASPIAVILEAAGAGGKRYRADAPADGRAFAAAAARLIPAASDALELAPVPDEPIAPETLGLRVDRFGLDTWGKLFNARQALTLTIFARLVREAYIEMGKSRLEDPYAEAVATYLGFAVNRLADYGSSLCRWRPQADQEKVNNTFARQAISMVWDYAESNPFADSSGGWLFGLEWVANALTASSSGRPGRVFQRDARSVPRGPFDAVITDPPYYNAIDYAGLSDFFYVWLKRAFGDDIHADLMRLPLTPKKEQAIMASESGGDRAARERYVGMVGEAFGVFEAALTGDGLMGVVFAHADPDAWATLIEGLVGANLVPAASWPIDTELENKIGAEARANLRTSVWMACQPGTRGDDAFLEDVIAGMRPVIRERLLYFWSQGTRGADFFISAIGPALSVFGRHKRVLRPDGGEVSVRDFLDIVRRESTQVALEQVLGGADLGQVDPLSRQYLAWVWSYSRAPLEAGEAISLGLATGADYHQLVRPHSVALEAREGSKKVVKLRAIRERGREDEDLGLASAARPPALVDQLQRAAYLWAVNQPAELALYRGELGESRWNALRTFGQAVAECLPDGDEDRRLILGLLGSNVMATTPRTNGAVARARNHAVAPRLPGLDDGG